MCTLSSNLFILTDAILDANLEEEADNVVLFENVLLAAEDGEDIRHELADALALVPPLSCKVMMYL